jgi:hypothetical protein
LIDRFPEKAQRQTLLIERLITWNAEPDKIMAAISQESLAKKLRPGRSSHKDRYTLPFSEKIEGLRLFDSNCRKVKEQRRTAAFLNLCQAKQN